MSLVLDALKKLEREKPASEPGVLVVGAVPWPGARTRRLSRGVLATAALLVLAATLAAWWFGRTRGDASSAATAPVVTAAAPETNAAASVGAPPAALSTSPAPQPRRLALPKPALLPASPATPAPEPATPSPGGPQLNAISQQEGRPVAVIDGRLVHEGDSIEGIRVLHIGETEVEIEVRGQRRTLRF